MIGEDALSIAPYAELNRGWLRFPLTRGGLGMEGQQDRGRQSGPPSGGLALGKSRARPARKGEER